MIVSIMGSLDCQDYVRLKGLLHWYTFVKSVVLFSGMQREKKLARPGFEGRKQGFINKAD
jgi:hypothetical protein